MKSGVWCLYKQQPYLTVVKITLADKAHKRLHMIQPEKKIEGAWGPEILVATRLVPCAQSIGPVSHPPTPKRNDAVPHPAESKTHIILRVDFHARTAPKHHWTTAVILRRSLLVPKILVPKQCFVVTATTRLFLCQFGDGASNATWEFSWAQGTALAGVSIWMETRLTSHR